MDYWESVSFFRDKIEETEKDIKRSINEGRKEALKETMEHYKNALHCICSKIKGPFQFHIMWEELRYKKGLPVYVREKKGNEWFGWWDILDNVTKEYITTAYSDKLEKKDKGIQWEIYDFESNGEMED